MYPHERSLVKQLADKPFALIGVNSDQDLDKIREIVKEKNLTWRSFQNDAGVDGVISDQWAIRGWPTLFILDSKGVIRWTGHGGGDVIDATITKCLAEMGHEVEITHDDHDEDDKKEDSEKEDSDKKDDSEKEDK